MKIGIRTPNLKSRVKARTTGKLKRDIKRAVNPLYGKKGMGLINDPKKALYNKIYSKTTVGINFDLRTTSGKSVDDYTSIADFLTDIDLDSISLDDIDAMTVEALELIANSKQKKLSKENKHKMDRINSRIVLGDIIPAGFSFDENVKTKSGKQRQEFTSDYIYLADLDLSTLTEELIDQLDIEFVKTIYHAKSAQWKRKEEKPVFKRIEQRYINDIL